MATYVYRRSSSTGARELAEALPGGIRYRATQLPIEQKARNGDAIVCWGETVGLIIAPNVKLLNNAPIRTKFNDAQILKQEGVPTIEVSLTKPVARPAVPGNDPALPTFNQLRDLMGDFLQLNAEVVRRRGAPLVQGITDLTGTLQTFQRALAQPVQEAQTAVEPGTWLGRMNSHVGGDDLLDPPEQADFYSKKVDFVKEFRVHSFMNKSIRAGVKEVREGFRNPHAWIRSWDGGWRIKYDGVSSKQKHREIAHAAVTALGLQFGAVDIGELRDGSLVVLEVNRAPGLEGGTVTAYAEAIQRWLAA